MRRAWLGAVVLVGAALFAGSAASAPSAPSATCSPTPLDAFGPFGQGAPPRRSKIGKGHVLTGVVLGGPACRPVKGAQVEFMQSGKNGYGPAGTATVVTNSKGRFRFEGPYPSEYGRPAHIHIRVQVAGFKTLLTRFEPRPGEKRGSIRLVLEPDDV